VHHDPVNYTDLTALDKADLAQATSPADAARRILARRGITVNDYVAQVVADAVLNHVSNTISVRESVERGTWQSPGAQDYMLQRLRHRLLDEITSQGLIPTALPTAALRYGSWLYGTGEPMRASETEPAEWDTVEVTVSAPVRVPPVDRKAAVKAGILGG
jgi:hypothetical protein